MTEVLRLPVIDLASPDRLVTSELIRQACTDHGFFYLVNHGVEKELVTKVFQESRKFFLLPIDEKIKLARKENRGYTPLYTEMLDPSLGSKGDLKESFYIGPLEDDTTEIKLNQWPSAVLDYIRSGLVKALGSNISNRAIIMVLSEYEAQDTFFCGAFSEILPSWRPTLESYYHKVLLAGKKLLSLISLGLNLNEDFFVNVGALERPMAFLRLLHYPVNLGSSEEELYGASAHSDYGMITLLVTDGVQGLQVCKDKDKKPQVWEDVPHLDGAFIVNIGDMMERWTNNLYRSTLHRVMPLGQERYSLAFFLDPNDDCLVECLESCCSESHPPRYPPIRSGDYIKERFRLTYGS